MSWTMWPDYHPLIQYDFFFIKTGYGFTNCDYELIFLMHCSRGSQARVDPKVWDSNSVVCQGWCNWLKQLQQLLIRSQKLNRVPDKKKEIAFRFRVAAVTTPRKHSSLSVGCGLWYPDRPEIYWGSTARPLVGGGGERDYCCLWLPLVVAHLFQFLPFSLTIISFFIYSIAPTKDEEDAQPVKKTYTWNTKEEAKQAFKELLKEKVFKMSQMFI